MMTGEILKAAQISSCLRHGLKEKKNTNKNTACRFICNYNKALTEYIYNSDIRTTVLSPATFSIRDLQYKQDSLIREYISGLTLGRILDLILIPFLSSV